METQEPTKQEPADNKTAKYLIPILCILLLFAIAACIYFYFQYKFIERVSQIESQPKIESQARKENESANNSEKSDYEQKAKSISANYNEDRPAYATENWKSYKQPKFKYNFKYPSDIGKLDTKFEDDYVSIFSKAATDEPFSISIFHISKNRNSYPKSGNLIEWLKDLEYENVPPGYDITFYDKDGNEVKGVSIYSPKSMQAASNMTYYYYFNGEAIGINFLDWDSEANKVIYDAWLSTFRVN